MARMPVRALAFLALVAGAGLAACEDSGDGGTDVRDTAGGGDPGPVGGLLGSCRSADGGCIENAFDADPGATTWDSLQQICTLGGATWVREACPTADLLGICTMPKSAQGQTVRNYCYDRGVVPPADQVGYCMTPCDQSGGTWTTP